MDKYALIWTEEDHNYFDFEPILLNHGVKAQKKFGYGIRNAVIFGKGFHAEMYLTEEELVENHIHGYSFLMNQEKFRQLLADIDSAIRGLKERIDTLLNIDLSKIPAKDLWDIYDFYSFKLGSLFVCYSMTHPYKVSKLEENIISFLEKKKVDDLHKAVSALTSPKTKFVFSDITNNLFKSFSESLKHEDAVIDKTLAKKALYKEEKSDDNERKAIIRSLKIPRKIVYTADVLRSLAEERFKMRFVWMTALYYNELFFSEFKRRFGVDKKDLRMYDMAEIDGLVLNEKKVSRKVLDVRKQGFLKILDNGDIETIQGKAAQKFVDEINKFDLNTNEISGMVASKGYSVGKVVKFSYKKSGGHSKKIEKMGIGDIVVTEMTRPNIITACEKAGAIVTDEGGILSHAAIISRELGVPCVIGTKLATRILNDGDFVEVDAETGIVRKITEKEYRLKRKPAGIKKISKKAGIGYKSNPLKKGDIFWFKEIDRGDLPTVGGKGANLGELYKFVNVPNGFCISVNAYRDFLKENRIDYKIFGILKSIKIENSSGLEKRAARIRKIILGVEIPEELQEKIKGFYRQLNSRKVAVRSSATAEDLPHASFAGQQDTYLNISNEKGLIEAVKKCWASLFTARAIYYREKNNFDHRSVLISVVVQGMIDSKYSGVMFTKDPIDKKDIILIEVVQGLGEKLVSGEVTPSSYLVNPDLDIISKKELFKFDQENLRKLSRIGKEIEKHYKSPQDIEWAIGNKGEIFILQSRAITTI